METLAENLSTPIEDVGDLLVVGAGSTGFAAALAAARRGLRTTLIDPASHVGGTLVSGIPILGYHDGVRQVVAGIADEIVRELHAQGGTEDYPIRSTIVNVDTERLRFVLLDLLEKAGVSLRLHTLVTGVRTVGGRLTHVITEGKGGRRALTARWFIDATGDADLAHAAGVPTEQGRKSDGKSQPMTLMFGIGGIDKTAFAAWGGYARMTELWRTQSAAFRNPRKTEFAHFWGPDSRTGEWAFNATRVLDADGADSLSLTRAEAEGRRQVFELMDRFLRPQVPGFERAFVAWTAPKIGVRETRRIVGHYTVTRDDVWNFVPFRDAICHGSYPIDIHSPTGATTEFPADHFYGGRYWSIPYRALVPREIDNLLVGGRCFSATHEAMSAMRVMANTLATGEAAGTAIALAQQAGLTPAQVDPKQLREELRRAGAWLPEAGD
jgi:hypothetical protein